MTKHLTGTREEWLAARLQLLEAEKELTRRQPSPSNVSHRPVSASREPSGPSSSGQGCF